MFKNLYNFNVICTCSCIRAHTTIQKHLIKSHSICVFLYRTNTEVVADEGGHTVFLTVSRSNGLESAVSVEWETQSDTAIASGDISVSIKSNSFLVISNAIMIINFYIFLF